MRDPDSEQSSHGQEAKKLLVCPFQPLHGLSIELSMTLTALGLLLLAVQAVSILLKPSN